MRTARIIVGAISHQPSAISYRLSALSAWDLRAHWAQCSDDLLGGYPAVPNYPPSGDLYFDVMTRLGDSASFATVAGEIKLIEGTRGPVATPEALYRVKKDTVRAQDREDAVALRERFQLKDER